MIVLITLAHASCDRSRCEASARLSESYRDGAGRLRETCPRVGGQSSAHRSVGSWWRIDVLHAGARVWPEKRRCKGGAGQRGESESLSANRPVDNLRV